MSLLLSQMHQFFELQRQLEERDNALIMLDTSWVEKNWPRGAPPASSPQVYLIALHKLRYEVTTMPDRLRHESRRWLEERGYGRLRDVPWPADKTFLEK